MNCILLLGVQNCCQKAASRPVINLPIALKGLSARLDLPRGCRRPTPFLYYCTCMEEYVDEEWELTPPGWIDFCRIEMEGRQQQACTPQLRGVWYYCTCMQEYMDEEWELTPPGWIDFSRVEMEGGVVLLYLYGGVCGWGVRADSSRLDRLQLSKDGGRATAGRSTHHSWIHSA